ncbi:DUF167 domain-containing protein [Candidatus Saccharibacteria bacterium]|nr:DUF167 domain-containing protein [Candidatus Saccharibacteria bacterium]
MAKYFVAVKPGSSQEKITQIGEDQLVVYLHARPHDGEANDTLIKLLARHFKVAKTTIKITQGAKSRNKVVEF